MKAHQNIGLLRTTPTFVAAGASDDGIGAVTYPPPAGHQAGDLLLLFIENDAGGAEPLVTTPSGWTLINTITDPVAPVTRLTVFYRIATSAAEPDASVNDAGDHQVGQMCAFRGVNTSDPIEASSFIGVDTASVNVSITGVTTLDVNRMVIYAASDNNDGASDNALASAWANASLVSLTEMIDCRTSSGLGGGVAAAYGLKAAAGATGTATATYATATNRGQCCIALKGFGP